MQNLEQLLTVFNKHYLFLNYNIIIYMNHITFQSITNQQQTEVLKYLQATNTEDIQEATNILSSFNFDSAKAITHKFSANNSNPNRLFSQRHLNEQQQPRNLQSQRQLAEYFAHVQRLHEQNILSKLATGSTYLVKILFRKLTYFIPEFVKQKIYYSKFDSIYKNKSLIKLQSSTLYEVLKLGKQVQKPCTIFIAPNNGIHPRILQILKSKHQFELMNTRFICYGITLDNKQVKDIFQGQQVPNQATIVFLYQTIFNKKKILRTYNIEQEEKQNDLKPESLKEIIQDYRKQRRHQKNIIIRYNNTILSYFHDEAAQHLMEDQLNQDVSTYKVDRQIRQQQTKQYQQAIQLSKKQEEQRLIKLKEEEQQRIRMESLISSRKIRASSIPDEPTQGDIIQFSFRCPNGSKIYRKFLKSEKIELIYDWVQTNEDIQFEQSIQRQFELMGSYPPIPLRDKKQKRLSEVFQEEQELLVIKQL